ncbi:ATP-grasp domain-containing protein [Phytohabitans kaempferiae]|uniref:Acetyl-CoA carboxylase biotin carboxylase subunit family protein n=1 Tax=Phytohabitans kaempferiae TaxID=1620943 RepID=A0ABV6M1X2_9ACTN
MLAVLVETPDYLCWREALGRRPFDVMIAAESPSVVDDLAGLLAERDLRPELVLAGFERYTAPALALARRLDLLQAAGSPRFVAPYKAGQRNAVAAYGLSVRQPNYAAVRTLDEACEVATDFSYPVVVKPGDGGGGLGVVLVSEFDGMKSIPHLLAGLANYDGGDFDGWLVEEYVKGTETSVQGVVAAGSVEILTYCEKLISIEPDPRWSLLASFREAGHVARPGAEADEVLRRFTADCLAAVGYQEGPFHVDLIRDGTSLRLLEMGFRLSGMRVTEIVRRVSGVDWAEATFRAHLRDGQVAAPAFTPEHRYCGQLTVRNEASLARAEQLAAEVPQATVEVDRYQPPQLPPEWGGQIPASLRSDIGRHAGATGRISVFSDSASDVTALLDRCRVATR